MKTPFQKAIKANITTTIKRMKKEGTCGASAECLLQCTPRPLEREGAPAGTNSFYYYREMFLAECEDYPVRNFIIE